MGWFAIVSLIFQYGPTLLEAIGALINAIRDKNQERGASAITKGMDVAVRVVLNLKAREGMTDDAKREQAWFDIKATLGGMGVIVTESEARTLAELAYQRSKAKEVKP